jgi:hypothetical protein
MKRSNHYEAALEGYLQWHRLCYVAVDETRRCYLGEDYVKNLDFIVHGEGNARLLIDVKGRRFPGGPKDRPRRVWENWATRADIDGLLRWQDKFGPGYRAVLVFAYLLGAEVDLSKVSGDLWTWHGKRFLLRAVPADDYQQAMRVRSPKWNTVSLPGATFRELARPFHFFTRDVPTEALGDCPF